VNTNSNRFSKAHVGGVLLLLCLIGTQTSCYTLTGTPGDPLEGAAVQNVHFAVVEGQEIAVHYDLLGRRATYSVSLRLLGENGTEIVPLSVRGDIGEIEPGRDHSIVWDIQRDLPHGLSNERYVFAVTAQRQRSLTPMARLGLAVGVPLSAVVLASAVVNQTPDETGTITLDVPDPE
jgi:hypothetical protein